jgi:O-antigen ligase
MTKKLTSYLTFILFLIPFSLWIVDNDAFFPFITTKALFFRILVSIGLAIAVWIYLLNPETFPKKNYLFLAIVLFFLANIIATIFSVNPYRSFWGNAERMEGLWSLFFYLSYFFLLFTLFQFNPQSKKIIFYSILIVSVFVSGLEIHQAFYQKADRPVTTLGNATYIGFFNMLVIFLILYFFFESNEFSKYVLMLLASINLLSLIGSQTRGSILGLLVGTIVFFFSYLIFSKIEIRKKIIFIFIIFLFLGSFFFFLKTDLALQVPGIKRISETLQNPVSVFPRLYAWKIFFNAYLDKPMFGWGQETMPVAFFAKLDPHLFNFEQAIFDRPHNKFVEVLATTGAVGFIAWLLIFVAFIYYVFKAEINLYQKSALLAFIFGYLAQNFSLFDMQASYILFFFGLSLVTPNADYRKTRNDFFIRPYLVFVFGLVAVLIVIHLQHFYIVRKIITYTRDYNPNRLGPNVDVDTKAEYVKKAAEGLSRLSQIAGPFLTEEAIMANSYLNERTMIDNSRVGFNFNYIRDYNTFFQFYDLIQRAYKQDKNDYRILSAYLLLKLSMIDILKQMGKDINNEIYEAEKMYNDGLGIYSNFPEFYLNFAQFFRSAGKYDKAKEILTNGEKSAINYPRYYFYEAGLYLSWQEPKIAYAKLNLALSKNFQPRFDNEFETTLNIYLENNDVENSKKIISLWLNVNNSSSTEGKITKILTEKKKLEILKVDKR